MSDRVLVMRMGEIVGEFLRDDCTDEILGAYAAGVGTNNCADSMASVAAQGSQP